MEEKVWREGMPVVPRADGRPPEPPEGFTIYTTEAGAMVLRRKRVRNLQRLGNTLTNILQFTTSD